MSALTTQPANDTNEAPFLAPETHQRAGKGRVRRSMKQREDAVLEEAARIMEARAKYGKADAIESPAASRRLLQMRLSHLEHEEFHCMWLDAQHRLIAVDSMFRGTLAQTSVYPREVVKAALRDNAAAVIFAHNHPSGCCEPSRADELLTVALKAALASIDVRVVDHVIATAANTYSFAEHGRI